MPRNLLTTMGFLLLSVSFADAHADKYTDTLQIFKDAGESGGFFDNAYGYAVFPTIGKGGLVVGAAGGSGRVYETDPCESEPLFERIDR